MAGKVTHLTFEELQRHIKQVVSEALGENNVHARDANATTSAQEHNQQGVCTTPADDNPNKVIKHDDGICKAEDTNPSPSAPLLTQYGNGTYLFYADDRLGCSVFMTFHPTSIAKLSDGIAILRGDVVFAREQTTGNIYIDFTKNRVYYRSRYKYDLEPDNRTKPLWDILVATLQSSLPNTN